MNDMFLNYKLYNKRNLENEIRIMEDYYKHGADEDYVKTLSDAEIEDYLWIDGAFKNFVWHVSREMMKGVEHCYAGGFKTKDTMKEHAEGCRVIAELNRPYRMDIFRTFLTGKKEFEDALRYEFVKNTLEAMVNGVRR